MGRCKFLLAGFYWAMLVRKKATQVDERGNLSLRMRSLPTGGNPLFLNRLRTLTSYWIINYFRCCTFEVVNKMMASLYWGNKYWSFNESIALDAPNSIAKEKKILQS